MIKDVNITNLYELSKSENTYKSAYFCSKLMQYLMAYTVFWLVNQWDALAVHLQVQSLISCDTFWLVFWGMLSSLLIHLEKMPSKLMIDLMMYQRKQSLSCILLPEPSALYKMKFGILEI